jgi:hypothetical protein
MNGSKRKRTDSNKEGDAGRIRRGAGGHEIE